MIAVALIDEVVRLPREICKLTTGRCHLATEPTTPPTKRARTSPSAHHTTMACAFALHFSRFPQNFQICAIPSLPITEFHPSCSVVGVCSFGGCRAHPPQLPAPTQRRALTNMASGPAPGGSTSPASDCGRSRPSWPTTSCSSLFVRTR